MTEEGPSRPTVQTGGNRTVLYAWIGALVFAVLFTLLIYVLGPFLDRFTLLPDQGASWYYWKLPTREFTTMFVVWTLYLGHQFAVWGAIYWAQKNLAQFRSRPAIGLTKYNKMVIVINLVFIFLHLIQTQIWFDGLAQDVPIWTSQGSVIVMLSVILVIENSRRGFFVGKKLGRPFTPRVTAFFRRNHAYIFAWALVYTFWFHPMSADPQLLTGFFYMFLLFTQVSLAYTWVHLNKRWVVTLETFVAFHAFVVAYFNTLSPEINSADMWPMFLSGFWFMFVFTYMYALGIRREWRWLVTLLYVVFLAWIYVPAPFGYGRDLTYLFRMEFFWIPVALYGLAIAFALLAGLYLRKARPADANPVEQP